MLEKAKNIVADIKADVERKKEEKEQLRKEQLEINERLEQERIALKARQEAERLATEVAAIQAEKNSLMNLSEKELLVEAVMALRGLYSRVEELEEAYDDLYDSISSMKKEISSVKVAEIRKDLEIASSRLQKL